MAKWNNKSKIANVIWVDLDHTLAKVFFESDKITEVPVISISNENDELAKRVKTLYTEADITQNTNDYNKYQGEREVLFQQFLESYLDWKNWKESKTKIQELEEQLKAKPKEVIVEKVVEKEIEKVVEKEIAVDKIVEKIVEKRTPTTLRIILNLAEDKASFFKLKLEIFELDQIKNSKDREMKASLRKAKTVPELLAHLHAAIPDLGNEVSSDLDKIPVLNVDN
jgi:hypothetical protein